MLALALALMFGAQTKLYVAGCAQIDTPSAVVPMADFRKTIANNEERKLLIQQVSVCSSQVVSISQQSDLYKRASIADSVAARQALDAKMISEQARARLKDHDLPEAVKEANKNGYDSGYGAGFKHGSLAVVSAEALIMAIIYFVVR